MAILGIFGFLGKWPILGFCGFDRFRGFPQNGRFWVFCKNGVFGESGFFTYSGEMVKNELFQEYLLEALIPGYWEIRTVEKPGYLDILVKTVSRKLFSRKISWNPGKTEE